MSGTENHIPPLPFQELMARLRDRGFIIGVEHHLRLSVLLDRIGWECHPSELKMLLCPIFARSEGEQEEFQRVFDELYPGFNPGSYQHATPSSSASIASSSTTVSNPKSRLPLIVAGIALLLVLSVVAYMALREDTGTGGNGNGTGDTTGGQARPIDTVRGPDTSLVPGKPGSAVPDTVPFGTGNTNQPERKDTTAPVGNTAGPARDPDTIRKDSVKPGSESPSNALPSPLWLGIIIPPLYVLARELYRYGLRRRQRERVQGRRLPYTVSVVLDRKHPVLYIDEEFHDLARAMRRRHAVESVRLDVEASVAATIGALGYPTFRYRHTSQVPEYLFLIDRGSPRDHQAMLHHELAMALEREGVFVASYWYDGDPRLCRSTGSGETLTMEELHVRHGHRRLLVFGEGRGLLDPETGRLKSWAHFFAHWPERGLMTPVNPRRWSREERTLASEFSVYPAHMTGVRTFIEHLGDAVPFNLRRWMQMEPSVPDDLRGAGAIPVLRRYLGPDLFRWLCACAVYPELHWDLTLHLGALPCMKAGLVTEHNVQMLARLEWFRAGSIPDDIRWLLMRELPHEAMCMTRRAIVDVLAMNLPPEGTFAENDYELKQATQQWLLNHDRSGLRHLLRLVSISPKSDLHRDRTLARFLRRDARRPWDAILPPKLHDVVYTHGIARLGLRTLVRVGMMLAVVTVASVLLWVTMPDSAESDPERKQDTTHTPVPVPNGPFLPPPVRDKGDTTKVDTAVGANTVI